MAGGKTDGLITGSSGSKSITAPGGLWIEEAVLVKRIVVLIRRQSQTRITDREGI
jgi:hypothetical protein